MLRRAINSVRRAATLPIANFGKTGTTQDSRDALFVGYAGDLVVGGGWARRQLAARQDFGGWFRHASGAIS